MPSGGEQASGLISRRHGGGDARRAPGIRGAADAGDALAQYNMAFMLERGEHGLTTDVADAMDWYRKAAKGGHGEAQTRLAIARLQGQDVMSSQVEAHKQLLEAAESGALDAMGLLGIRYCDLRKDIYPPADAELGMKWLTRALEAQAVPLGQRSREDLARLASENYQVK